MIGRRSHDDAQAFDQAWSGGSPRDEHIADLLRVADELCRSAADVQPSPAFRSSLRAELMAEAVDVLTPVAPAARPAIATAPAGRRSRRRIATVTAGLVASAGAVGVVASSASAVPGEMLYPVKRSVESVELQLHRGDASRGAFQLSQASERLAEARRLSADAGPADLIADTLEDFSEAATEGSGRLFTAYTADGGEESIQQVNDFAASSSADLSELSTQLPDDIADAFSAATTAVTRLASEASSLCSSCAPADVRALAGAVPRPATSATQKPATSSGEATAEPEVREAAKPTAPAGTAPRPSVTPAPQPTLAPPVAPSTKAPSLTDLTDPLVGGLLGDEQQPGLVPGLLGGLLGPKK